MSLNTALYVNTTRFQQVRERGLMKYKWQEWRPPKPRCLLTRDVVSVEINTISFAFFLLISGLSASVSILIIERLFYDRYVHLTTINTHGVPQKFCLTPGCYSLVYFECNILYQHDPRSQPLHSHV